MLSFLSIENIAVIEKVQIAFENGFNILTGETGAGKSIIIDSIEAILGERTPKDLIRSGEKSAYIGAQFSALGAAARALIEEEGFFLEDDDSILIEREIRLDGRNLCRVGGRPAPLSALRRLGPALVTILGQHDSYDLLSRSGHIAYLDATLSECDLETLKTYRETYRALKELGRQIDSLESDEAEKARRTDMLTFQINELESAKITSGEREALTSRREAAEHARELSETARSVLWAIGKGEGGAAENASSAASQLENATRYFSGFSAVSEKLREAENLLLEAHDLLYEQSGSFSFDENEIEPIDERLDALYRLSVKYGKTEDDMLAFLKNAKDELAAMESSDERREALLLEYDQKRHEAIALAKEISEKRRAAAERFETRVKEELSFLDMPSARFVVSQKRAPLNENGCDEIAFLLSVNPGEELRELSKVASGGELSRIMLAIKTVLSGSEDTDTFIFDEIDAGISGSAAQKVGRKLREISNNVQVLCVTHLPQIAALADHHFHTEKNVLGEKTFTSVRMLDFDGRAQELAHMIGGAEITQTMLRNAEEMLKKGAEA